MSNSKVDRSPKLPGAFIWAGNGFVLLHLLSILVVVLSAPSGLWPTAYGSDTAMGPQFAVEVSNITTQYYLRLLGMTHNYHFESNRVAVPEVYFEVRLRDQEGEEIKRVKFPEEDASLWIRHRQRLLAQRLSDDRPMQNPGAEKVAPRGQKTNTISVWVLPNELPELKRKQVLPPTFVVPMEMDSSTMSPPLAEGSGQQGAVPVMQQHFRLVTIREDQDGALSRTRPLMRPSEWTLLLQDSYCRYLCRKYGAHSAELIRHSRPAVMPMMMFMPAPVGDSFTEMVANFGESSKRIKEGAR
ncbi:MAG: hypothetical protein ACFCD0_05725 [Gemmataceae bacterium]